MSLGPGPTRVQTTALSPEQKGRGRSVESVREVRAPRYADSVRPARAAALRASALLGLGLALGGIARWFLGATLHDARFVTGWLLLVPLVAICLAWLGPGALRHAGSRRHLALAVSVLALFVAHTGLRVPTGLVERGLTAGIAWTLVAAFVASVALAGSARAPHDAGHGRPGPWVRAHVAVLYSLLALGLYHALFVHAHGALSHLLLPEH